MNIDNDQHIVGAEPLTAPDALAKAIPLAAENEARVAAHRQAIVDCIAGRDRRPLVIVGPCSIHDPVAARDYARRLAALRDEVADRVLVVMRVYFEKPRTTVGWKGLINDPHLDGSYAIEDGLRQARELLVAMADLDLPVATEFLDPITPAYLADGVAWTAIGARTTESQTHRQMASGLSMPVGFKNGTDGSLTTAVQALTSCASPHRFVGVDDDGRAAVITTSGNPDGHLVLRGGKHGPNFAAAAVAAAVAELQAAGVCERLLVDCSHANSSKDHRRQGAVLAELCRRWVAGDRHVFGAMLESHIKAGRQDTGHGDLSYGQSITDACIGFDETVTLMHLVAESAGQLVAG